MDDLAHFKRGFAVGRSDIRNDCLYFRFYDEVFKVRNRSLKTKKSKNGLLAKIEDVRVLKDA